VFLGRLLLFRVGALGASGGPKAQSNTRTAGSATTLGVAGGPKVQSHTRTVTTGPSTPQTFGQRGLKNLGPGTQKNVSRGAPKNFAQRGPSAIHPAQGSVPHVTYQRVVTR
jgi:hypothetical protein